MLFFSVAGFVTLYALQRVVLEQPVHDQHDRALKLVISVSLRPNNERRHGPPPDRPARRCAHAIKRRGLHKVATIRLTAPAYWKFESIPLQERVSELSVPGRRIRGDNCGTSSQLHAPRCCRP